MMLLSDGACDYLTVELSMTLTVRHITSCEDPLGVELGSVPFDLDEDAVYSLIASYAMASSRSPQVTA